MQRLLKPGVELRLVLSLSLSVTDRQADKAAGQLEFGKQDGAKTQPGPPI